MGRFLLTMFIDFDTGRALHLSGHAVVEWSEPGQIGTTGEPAAARGSAWSG
jgi:hypothetical protein